MKTEKIAICIGCSMALQFDDFEWGTTQAQLTSWLDDLAYRNNDAPFEINIIGDEVEDAEECGICFDYHPKEAVTGEIKIFEV